MALGHPGRILLTSLVLAALAGCAAPSLRIPVSSRTHAFSPSEIMVPAGERFVLVYRNEEPGAQHNLAVYAREGGEPIAVGDSVVGPDAVTELEVSALAPGTYYFQCDIHPFMNGTITAESG
jgi:plastocyanin